MAYCSGGGGLSGSMVIKANPMEIELSSNRRQARSSARGCQQVCGSRSNREVAFARRSILVEPVHNSRSQQDGGSTSTPRDYRQERLDDEDRSQGCVHGGTIAYRIEKIPIIPVQECNLPIQIASIRDERSATCVQQPHEICDRTLAEEGNQNGILPRRLVYLSQDETRNGMDDEIGTFSSTRLRVYHQLQEECSTSIPLPGILGIPVQQQDDDHTVTKKKIGESTPTGETGAEGDKNLQMDRCFVGEDDSLNASNRRSLNSRKVHPEGSGKSEAKMDLNWWLTMSTVKNGLPIAKPPPAPPAVTIHVDASDSGWGVSSKEIKRYGFWNDEDKKWSINVRELKAIKFALQMHAASYQGQTMQVYSDNITALKDTKFMQPTPTDSDLPTCSWGGEHGSGQVEPNEEASTRIQPTQEGLQANTADMADPIDGGCVRLASESQVEEVLELDTRCKGREDRCIPTTMAKNGIVFTPTMEVGPMGFEEDSGRSGETMCAGDTIMDNAALVANGNAAPDRQGQHTVNKEFLCDRLAIIKQQQEGSSIDKEATWCLDQEQGPTQYAPKQVVQYLITKSKFSFQHLNGIRSAIASVYRELYGDRYDLANEVIVQQCFKAKKRKELKLPNINQETYDVTPLLTMVDSWGKNETLTLEQLQKKNLVSLTLATMWRPGSDMGKLQFRDVSFLEGNPKTSKLGATKLGNVCPVQTLFKFVQRTIHLRRALEEEHTLFLAYIDKDDQVPRSIKPKTTSNWLRELMKDAGIDTSFKPHSLRSASSTRAASSGIALDTIKLHAHWSLNSNTFEKYYYKPNDQHQRGASMVEAVFGDVTKKRTTSGVGVEANAIVVGTTHNGDIAETKTKDVLATQPWYRRLF
ncbi:hypothetical protein G6F43_011417 [Rhizopus delemar]|nr:hypothetical protein G6F43_011417 [Rhizopus delemar]